MFKSSELKFKSTEHKFKSFEYRFYLSVVTIIIRKEYGYS